MRTILAAALSLATLTVAAPAWAGGSEGSIGVGAEYTLLGTGGLSVNYDAGAFHAGGFIGYYKDVAPAVGEWDLDLGGRFFFHVHETAMADFSLGGQLGIQLQNNVGAPDNDFTIVTIDLGAQIRVFLQSNVALSATLGVGIATADGDGFALTGGTIGSAGIHYYFF